MGPRASSASQGGDYEALLRDYQVVKQVEHEGLLYLKNRTTGAEQLLREFTFNDKREFDRHVEMLEKRKVQLANCKYVVPLEKVLTKSQDQYCSTFYKIYALFQFTDRTLQDEINERNLQKRKFQEKELWSILASCILGLSHLQKQTIKHQSLRSDSILISQDGVVKIYDPICTGAPTNYDALIAKRTTPHIYLSPQLTDSLQLEAGQPHCHAYKSDIWTLGMIILEVGLAQYQDECYRDECSRVHWETLQYNIHRFRQNYSEDLAAFVEFMLSRDEKNRPDWCQLEERVMKEEESRVSYANQGRQTKTVRISQTKMYPAPVIYSQPERKTTAVLRTPDSQFFPHPPSVPVYHEQLSGTKFTPFRPVPAQPQTTVYPKATIEISQVREFGRPTASANLIPVRPSNIEATRPYRNIFPSNLYFTNTKIDENLIVVPEEEHYSDVEDTPNNRYHSSYFDSNPKSRAEVSAITAKNNNQFYNAFTPTAIAFLPEQPKPINNYGVSLFQPQVAHAQSEPVAETIADFGNGNGAPAALNEQSGEGDYVVQRYKQGSEYKGYKWNGMRHGYGIFYYQDGGMYDGQWRYNKMEGHGKLFYQSGKLAYEGEWSQDQFSGKGTLFNQYPDITREPINYRNLDEVEQLWTKYEGDFREDVKSGRGILFLSNGEYYDGEFRSLYAHNWGDGHWKMEQKHIRKIYQKGMNQKQRM